LGDVIAHEKSYNLFTKLQGLQGDFANVLMEKSGLEHHPNVPKGGMKTRQEIPLLLALQQTVFVSTDQRLFFSN
jgi:hypothetical protein